MSETDAKAPEMDRMFPDVVCPPLHPLMLDELMDENDLPKLDVLKEHLLKEGRLHQDAVHAILSKGSDLFIAEPNLLELQYPITVCGDVHGQYFDLVRLLEVGGDPKDTQYLFLGDYVDRGCFSTEVVFYLFALKINYPKTLFMLRGNHECRQLTSFFNFKDECSYKYDLATYDAIMNAFDALPISATVNNSFFCVHGGLSPDLSTLREVTEIDRFQEIPREGPMCDLLWSDPYEDEAEEDEGDMDDGGQTSWFGYNETRQCSYVFGVEAVKQFLTDNKLTSIIRAHEAQVDGYKMHMVNKTSGIPRVITIFSAPNYCDVYKNKAACLKFDNNVLNIKQFIDSPHPYYLPNFMDVFQWSLPFVAEKVTDMLANILDVDDEDSGEDEKKQEMQTVLSARVPLLRKKVLAITKIVRMYKALRENNEAIVELKQLTPNKQLPFGLLTEGADAIKDAISGFNSVLEADEVNERRPQPAGEGPPRPRSDDPRRNSITVRKKRGSLPGVPKKPRRGRGHLRNVKSEDLSCWNPATPEEPAFKLTPTVEEGNEDEATTAE